jgi:hypothetical protein
MSTIYPGQSYRYKFEVRDEGGELVTPATIVVTHVNPAGTPTVIAHQLDTSVHPAGAYYADYTFVDSDAGSGPGGTNRFQVQTTGPDWFDQLIVRVKDPNPDA